MSETNRREADEDVCESRGNVRPGVCRSAPAAGAQRRTSVPLDRHPLEEKSLGFVGVGGDYDAAIQRRRPLPVEARHTLKESERPIPTGQSTLENSKNQRHYSSP